MIARTFASNDVLAVHGDLFWVQAHDSMWLDINPEPATPVLASLVDAWDGVVTMSEDKYAGIPLGLDWLGTVLFAVGSRVHARRLAADHPFHVDIDRDVLMRAFHGFFGFKAFNPDPTLIEKDAYWCYRDGADWASSDRPSAPVVESISRAWQVLKDDRQDCESSILRFAEVLWSISATGFMSGIHEGRLSVRVRGLARQSIVACYRRANRVGECATVVVCVLMRVVSRVAQR